MANTPDMTSCRDTGALQDAALSPFYMLNYHFGMLLGVDDFATEQAHHRGKMRLHNGWLHGEGVAWGYNVKLDIARGEVRVLPGLAYDRAGHELHLERDACLNVGAWFKVHQKDPGLEVTDEGPNRKGFTGRVEIRHKTCLTRQVPALLEPCDGGGGGTAYSRIFETVDIRLEPGFHTDPERRPYHRCRVLMSIEPASLPDDQDVIDARDAILAMPAKDQPAGYVEALRNFAALDEIDLEPAGEPDEASIAVFAAEDSPPVVLADLELIVENQAGAGEEERWQVVDGSVDVTVRPSLIATSTIQELLCGPLLSGVAGQGEDGGEKPPAGEGPRVLPDTVNVADQEISFDVDRDLAPASVKVDAFSVSAFDETDGWTVLNIGAPDLDGRTVRLRFDLSLPSNALLRLIAYGRGPRPLLGANLVPLAGRVGGPEPAPHDGLDFVWMERRKVQ